MNSFWNFNENTPNFQPGLSWSILTHSIHNMWFTVHIRVTAKNDFLNFFFGTLSFYYISQDKFRGNFFRKCIKCCSMAAKST